MEPGYYNLTFEWYYLEKCHLALDLHWVHDIRVETGGGRDALVATFFDACLLPLTIQLRPFVACRWGTTDDCP
jgi:hypothetical protein